MKQFAFYWSMFYRETETDTIGILIYNISAFQVFLLLYYWVLYFTSKFVLCFSKKCIQYYIFCFKHNLLTFIGLVWLIGLWIWKLTCYKKRAQTPNIYVVPTTLPATFNISFFHNHWNPQLQGWVGLQSPCLRKEAEKNGVVLPSDGPSTWAPLRSQKYLFTRLVCFFKIGFSV